MHSGIQTLKPVPLGLWLFLAKYIPRVCCYSMGTRWIDIRLIGFAIPVLIPVHILGHNPYTRPTTLVPSWYLNWDKTGTRLVLDQVPSPYQAGRGTKLIFPQVIRAW